MNDALLSVKSTMNEIRLQYEFGLFAFLSSLYDQDVLCILKRTQGVIQLYRTCAQKMNLRCIACNQSLGSDAKPLPCTPHTLTCQIAPSAKLALCVHMHTDGTKE